jgi:membrane fusion protein, multidrug efflux system
MTSPAEAVRLGMTGDAVLSPAVGADPLESAQSTYVVPATAIFHLDGRPAVWIVGAGDSTLQLRPVKVRSYGDRSSVITAGLKDGEVVVLAGVHTVHAGQRVQPVEPLFNREGDIEGPANTVAP